MAATGADRPANPLLVLGDSMLLVLAGFVAFAAAATGGAAGWFMIVAAALAVAGIGLLLLARRIAVVPPWVSDEFDDAGPPGERP